MKTMKFAAFLCLALVVAPTLGAAARLKRPLNIDVENAGRSLQASERIAYGQVASKGQFPFMARLAWISASGGGYTACGGTVISPNYILTAAHCMYDENNKYDPPTTVLLGGTDIQSLGNFPEKIAVAEGYVPTQYQAGVITSNYDVAILKLKVPTSYPAVTLPSSPPSAGTSLTSIGWGLTEKSSNGFDNDFLLYTELKVGTFGQGECPLCPQNPCTILCELGVQQGAGKYTSACQGDSGGPQVLAGTTTQVSVVSFGPEGCGNEAWGASTSTAAMRSWINGIIGGSTPEPSPSPSPTPEPSPSPSPTPTPIPTPTPSPKPTPTPTPTGCTLDQTKGDVVQITYKSVGCAADATKAAATAAAQSSGATKYCITASKCTKLSGGNIKISAKLAVNIDRVKAKANMAKAFSSGTYSSKFKTLLPASYKKYIFQSGSSCVFPGISCTY